MKEEDGVKLSQTLYARAEKICQGAVGGTKVAKSPSSNL